MTASGELLALLSAQVWHGFAVFLRVGALVAMLPAFGEQSIPARVKLAVALAFTFITAPALAQISPPESFGTLGLMVMSESLAGLAIGIGVRLFVLALQTAGSIAAQSTSLSQVLGGAAVDPLPAMGYILIVGGLALAVMTGLHVKAALLIILSYDFIPFGQFASASDLTDWGVEQIAHAFALAFTLAAPFVILSVVYNLALGAINKAMPQLMVAFVGAPLITAGGLALLMIAAPSILAAWTDAMDHYLADPFGNTR
ncbi:flagellar biosynthetic protein FliR [uncultured Roseobacter sp.]|uniref:flagellar biosynthetic protein FliR n=1 Tax=uncultured Roseobacter sp. TaxID=114847 RepID=UPI002611690C|nr:flagellar biosynthetic protein FliR [uncultured Roseobacter sp.]